MKTIQSLLLLCMLAFGSLQLSAQEPGKAVPDGPKNGSRKEKIEALRVAYITKELDLSETEAQTFWPVYNEYHKKQEALRKEFKSKYNKQTDYNFATDKEAEDYINADIQLKMQEAELIKTYYDKIKKVLPVKKVAKLRHAEESFRQEIMKQIKRKMGE
jgi:Spy/CpxP family protein refolding chaperone